MAPAAPADRPTDRFGRALTGLSQPKFGVVGDHSGRAVNALPRHRLNTIADRVGLALSWLPRPRPSLIAGIVGLLFVLMLGGLLVERNPDWSEDAAPTATSPPAVVAETPTVPETDVVAPAPTLAQAPHALPKPVPVAASKAAPAKEEPPQRLTVTENAAATPVVDVPEAVAGVARVSEHPRAVETEAVPVATPLPESDTLHVDSVRGIDL